MTHPVSLYRMGHFNAAHQLAIPSWSMEKNLETFGKCANPNFHGHNYEVEVRVTGHLDPETGILINLDLGIKLYETPRNFAEYPGR